MANQEFLAESDRTTAVLEQLKQEIEQTPPEYLSNLLQIVRLFRESVTLKPAEAILSQEWQEATPEQTQLVTEENAWDVLEAMTGTIEAPSDWSSEHDYYLYSTPKHQPETIE
jgi:3-methyladenine DNA glycosylase AlkD